MAENTKKRFLILLAVLVTLTGLALVIAALLPYGTFKHLADSLKPNGNFKTLKESNALIFRLLLGAASLALFAAAFVLGTGRVDAVRNWLRQSLGDCLAFVKSLKPDRAEWPSLAILGLIIVLALVFRLNYINAEMTHDESYTFVVFSSTSVFNIVTNYQLPNNHVFNSLLVFLSTRLFGIQPWAVRLPALLAGVLVVPAAYALAKAVYDRYTALASALLVAILPGAVAYSTAGRGYSLVALFALLCLWLADYVRRNKNRFAWSLLALLAALGFYSVPVMLIPFGIVFAWLFFEALVTDPGPNGSKTGFMKYWLVAGLGTAALVLLLYTPIFIYTGADKVFANHWVQPDPWAGYLGSLPRFALNVWGSWTGGLPTWIGPLLIAGFILGLVFHRRIARQRFPLQLAAFVWIAVVLLVQRPHGETKAWLSLMALFAVWCAAGIFGLLEDLRLKFARNVSAAAVLSGLAILIVLVWGIRVVPGLPRSWAAKGPAENTVLYLKDQVGAQDRIIIDAPYDAAVWYYSRLYGLGGDPRFNQRLPFDHLFVIVSRAEGQTVNSVLQDRGPDLSLVDLESAHIVVNFQRLDTYEVSHR